MSKIVSDPRLPVVKDEKIRPLTQRLYELFRQYAIAHNKSYMWDTEGTAAPTTGTWSISQMCKNTAPSAAGIIGWVCTTSGTPGTWYEIVSGGKRELLTSNRTYYVRTDGSDSNNGLANTSGGAFLTIQKAIDVVCSLDMSIYQVTIQVADGTYTTPVVLKQYIGSLEPLIIGNTTTPSNCIISTTSANCIDCNLSGVSWNVRGFKLTTTTSGSAIYARNGSRIYIQKIDFGSVAGTYGTHILSDRGGVIVAVGNYSITGGGFAHAWSSYCGGIVITSRTITITGTPNFTKSFLFSRFGYFEGDTTTYSGSATGKKYDISMNAVAFTNGYTLPGDVAGTTATGAQYS